MKIPKKKAALVMLEKCKCGHKEDYNKESEEEMEYDVKSDQVVKKDGTPVDDEIPQELLKLMLQKMDSILEFLDGASSEESDEDAEEEE